VFSVDPRPRRGQPALRRALGIRHPGPHQDFGRRKDIDHPDVGRIMLDCDTLVVAADDLRIMIYTAEPDTEDAERLSLAIVLGTQSLID
jgi:hypothetical protein